MNIKATNLRVVFICSSVHAGHDGVGDYTCLLAAALIAKGHSCAIVALNDRGVAQNVIEEQDIDGTIIPVLRISSTSNDQERYTQTQGYIKNFNPDWLSLQYVPFGFDVKGLKFGLARRLKLIHPSARWHFMIHELWVGMDEQSSFKHKLWGFLQKQLIKSLLRKIKPSVITTQSLLYRQQLAAMGYQAAYLPLHANIPVVGKAMPKSAADLKDIRLVIFGNIHYGAPLKDFVEELVEFGREKDITFSLTLLGHCGPAEADWINTFRSAGLAVQSKGQQPAGVVSQVLADADIAITTTPVSITDKSGSFAAMRAHNLPVISVARPWTASGFENIIPDGVFYYQKGNFKAFYAKRGELPSHINTVDEVAKKLADLLLSF